MSRVPLTAAEKEQILALRAEGISRIETARRLGRDPSAVGKVARAAGVPFAPPATLAVAVGDVFGRLTVTAVEFEPTTRHRRRRVVTARCECGTTRVYTGSRISFLVRGALRSCGCLRREVNGAQIAFRNAATRGVPLQRRKEAWEAVRCSVRDQPEQAQAALEQASGRAYLSNPAHWRKEEQP